MQMAFLPSIGLYWISHIKLLFTISSSFPQRFYQESHKACSLSLPLRGNPDEQLFVCVNCYNVIV